MVDVRKQCPRDILHLPWLALKLFEWHAITCSRIQLCECIQYRSWTAVCTRLPERCGYLASTV